MNIPPYFPEPIEIPGNASESRYTVRLGFIRRVLALHFLTVGAVVSVVLESDQIPLNPAQALVGTLLGLGAMSVIRQLAINRSKLDAILSWLILPPFLICLGRMLAWGGESGAMLEVPLAGLIGWFSYAVLCGRDFSFIGQFGVSLIAALGFAGWNVMQVGQPLSTTTFAFLGTGAMVFYLTYDLAMVTKRRRPDEVWPAVCDLYRDLLNGITYSGRVLQHWRKYPLGTLVPKDGSS